MMRKKLVMVVLCLFAPWVWAESCTADVENEGAKLSGRKFYTSWHVRHDAGKEHPATVTFDYRIRYRNVRNNQLTFSGYFNEMLHAPSAQINKEDASGNEPVEILAVEFRHVTCRYY